MYFNLSFIFVIIFSLFNYQEFFKGNTSRFGFAIQVLPSDILGYFGSFFITVVVVVSIYILSL